MRRPLATVALAAALAVALLPALPASACTAPRTPERPAGYCENPGPIDPSRSPTPTPSPIACVMRMVTFAPAYPSWGLDGNGKQGVDVFANPEATVTLSGYERPSTDVRVLGTVTTNHNGYGNIPVRLQGHTRLFMTTDEPLCGDRTETRVALVQVRLGTLQAFRNGPRDYSFTTFYAGPAGKVGNLYRVLPDGREVLTSQTRMAGEWVHIRRVFTGSGRFGFVLRSGDDINALGASTSIRDTVIH